MTNSPDLAFAAFVGIDWADQHHDLALQVADGPGIETMRLAHEPAALAAWLTALHQRFGGQPVAIALETSRGPLVHALLEAPFVVLYPINPRSLRRFRETFSPNGAKDDAPDARLLLTLLVQHRAQLHAWHPDDLATRTLHRLVQQRRAAVDLRTQLTLQLQAVLKESFPQALRWAGAELTSPLACRFLQRWPTLQALQRARPATIRAFYITHGSRRAARLTERLAEIAAATPLTRDNAVLTSSVLQIELLTRQLQALAPSVARLDAAIAQLFASHPDAAIFASLPRAGAALAPRLLVAFGTDRSRFASAADVQQQSGIAPITIRSGRHQQVRWRWATSTFLRQTFQEFAHHTILDPGWARTFYHHQRQRGNSHHAAVRVLAYKWIRILWRCWQDRTPYESARYERALHARGSLHAFTPALTTVPA